MPTTTTKYNKYLTRSATRQINKIRTKFNNDIETVIGKRRTNRHRTAKKMGVHPAYLTHYLDSTGSCSLRTMVRMAHALGAKVEIRLVS